MLDLRILGGTLMLPDGGERPGALGISGGRIVLIGADDTIPDARETIDASGRVVMPGIVDPHVHIGLKAPFSEELESETQAAVAGGITTVGAFLRQKESYLPDLPRLIDEVETRSHVDVFWHASLVEEHHVREVETYVRDFGITSFKSYMAGVAGMVGSVDDDLLLRSFERVAAMGDGALLAVHAENPQLVEGATRRLRTASDGLASWHAARPDIAEAEAITRAACFADVAGCRLYVVHLTSGLGLEHALRAREAGVDLVLETTSTYLTVDETHPAGTILKRFPPVRSPQDREALWAEIRDGGIATIGTDNVTSTRAENAPERGIWDAHGGYGGLYTHLPCLLDEAARRGLPLETLLPKITSEPAKVFGLYPRKGALALGSDADVVVVDPALERTVDPAESPSRGDWTPYDGSVLRGWPVVTVKHGDIVARDHRVIASAHGRYLPRQR